MRDNASHHNKQDGTGMDYVKIDLTNNNGFSWYKSEKIFFKGYLLEEGRFITGMEAAEFLLLRLLDTQNIQSNLIKLNGIFSFIIRRKNDTLISQDRIRSFPLFYTHTNGILQVSDDPALLRTENSRLDPEAVKIFLHTGYTTGDKTLYTDIFQIQAGEYIKFSGPELIKEFYHHYESREIISDAPELENELFKILNEIGDDLASSLKGKSPVIPLSSGYDSRLIAAILKKRGFEDVITFTYGRKDNPELELSKRSAEKLGFGWRYFEYSEDTVKDFIRSDRFRSYFPKASNYSSMFYLQEYFALEELKMSLSQNSVFIPGHSGDFFAGSHLNKKIISSVSEKDVIGDITKKHYGNKSIEDRDKADIKKSIKYSLAQKEQFSFIDFENWDLKERQAKFILNSNRIYEYFGYEYRLPLMDNRLMDFFSKVSPDLKYGKKLYDKVLKERFFNEPGLNFINETNPTVEALEKQEKKNCIKNFIPQKIINFYKEKLKKNYDIYYNIGVTDQMIDDLENSGVQVDETGENRNSVIIQWYINQIKSDKI